MVEYAPHINTPSSSNVLPLTLNTYVTSACSPDIVVLNPNICLKRGEEVEFSLLYDNSYKELIGPLNGSGGIHVSVTDVAVLDVTLKDRGIDGAKGKNNYCMVRYCTIQLRTIS